MTNKDAVSLTSLAKSWLKAPAITDVSGGPVRATTRPTGRTALHLARRRYLFKLPLPTAIPSITCALKSGIGEAGLPKQILRSTAFPKHPELISGKGLTSIPMRLIP